MALCLRTYIEFAKDNDLLLVVRDEVERDDLPEIIEILSRKAKVLLFERLSGYNLKVIANLVPSLRVFSLLFGEEDPYEKFSKLSQGRVEKVLVDRKDEFITTSLTEDSDLTHFLPILKHYEDDSAPFITSSVVSSIDPETGFIGRGIHRMEFRGGSKLGVSLLNPPLSEIFEKYRSANVEMPISVSIGLDPITFLAMALRVPYGVDKLEVAGALRGEGIEVIKSFDSEIDVPKEAEFLLEGKLDPHDLRKDGPLGEISGYYLTLDGTPTVRITRISHRKDPIYHALLPTSLEANMYLTFVSKAHIEAHIRELFPFVIEVHFVERTFGSSVIVSTREVERPKINNLIHFVLSFPMIKKVIVVEEDVEPKDLKDVEWALITRCFAEEDLIVVSSMQGQPIDPESKMKKGVAKIGINATSYGKDMEKRARVKKGERSRIEKVLKGILDA